MINREAVVKGPRGVSSRRSRAETRGRSSCAALLHLVAITLLWGSILSPSSRFSGVADAASILNQDGMSTSGAVHGKPLGKKVLLLEHTFTDVVTKDSSANFRSGVFDGSYIWLFPSNVEKILRININDHSNTAFDGWPAGVAGLANKFKGGAFDGTKVWLVPYDATPVVSVLSDGTMAKYDDWPTPGGGVSLNIGARPFNSAAVVDGVLYMIPWNSARLVSLFTANGTMAIVVSNNANVNFDLRIGKDYRGSASDGSKLWLAPATKANVASYDPVTGDWESFSNWPTEITTPGQALKFYGASYDGTFIWLIPFSAAAVVRLDPGTGTMQGYTGFPSGVNTISKEWAGGCFDGEAIWMVPRNSDVMVRVETADGSMLGYTDFPASAPLGDSAFMGCVYDGTSIWLSPVKAAAVVRITPPTRTETSSASTSHPDTSSHTQSRSMSLTASATKSSSAPSSPTGSPKATHTLSCSQRPTRSTSSSIASTPTTARSPTFSPMRTRPFLGFSISVPVPPPTTSAGGTPAPSGPPTAAVPTVAVSTDPPPNTGIPPNPTTDAQPTVVPTPAPSVNNSNVSDPEDSDGKTTQNTTTEQDRDSATGTTAGIVIGVLLFLIILVVIAVVLIMRRGRNDLKDRERVKESSDRLETHDLLVASPAAEDTSGLNCVGDSTGTETSAPGTYIAGLPDTEECGTHHELGNDDDGDDGEEGDGDPQTDVSEAPGQVTSSPAVNEMQAAAVNNSNSSGTVSNDTPGHPPSHGSSPFFNRMSEGSNSLLIKLQNSPYEMGTSIHSHDTIVSTGSDVPGNPLLSKTLRRKLLNSTIPGTRKPIRFIKGQMIGSGGFGRVYQGLDEVSGTLIAAKEIVFDSNAGGSWDDHVLALRREIDVMKRLNHPNVVRYYGGAKEENSFYIFMEHVAGGSVRGILAHHGALSVTMARDFTTQMLDGLGHIHAHGLIHRDIKSANTLIDAKGIVKIIDFGASRNSSTVTGTAGTPCWMAPEVLRGEAATAASDVWSVGCTVMEMLTGKTPWSHVGNGSVASTMYHIGREDKPLEIPPFGSSVADEFVRLCLQRNPVERPTAEQLLEHAFCDCDIDEDGIPIEPPMEADIDAPSVVPAPPQRPASRPSSGTWRRSTPTIDAEIEAPSEVPAPARPASRPSSGTWRRSTPQPQSPVPGAIPPSSSVPLQVVVGGPLEQRTSEVEMIGAPQLIGAGGGFGLPPRHPGADMDLSNMQRHSSVVVTASMIDVDADRVDTIDLESGQ